MQKTILKTIIVVIAGFGVLAGSIVTCGFLFDAPPYLEASESKQYAAFYGFCTMVFLVLAVATVCGWLDGEETEEE